ncbi:MAG: ATP-dependent zinc metalloprotease FTSH 4, mitochondrial [Alyxoria varia]|nr:MAG: ATP-dependent zinc metalloprotease FTSH 4, mitochondrial [Alyxoria varia]
MQAIPSGAFSALSSRSVFASTPRTVFSRTNAGPQHRIHLNLVSSSKFSTSSRFSARRNEPLNATPKRFPSLSIAASHHGALRYFPNLVARSIQVRLQSSVGTSHNVLAHLESTANNNPSSASSQNAFYAALLRANMPEILAERYETGRYATNPACDAMYSRALERMSQSGGSAAQGGRTGSFAQQGRLSPTQLQAVGSSAAAHHYGSSAEQVHPQQGDKPNHVHVTIGETKFGWAWKILTFGLVVGGVLYAVSAALSIFLDSSGIMKKVGGTQNAEVKPQQQKARFSDVKGVDEAKDELQEVVDFLKSPDKYNKLGGKLPKGVLMIGPPGTGKTLLARAVAGEAGVPFFYMSGSEFDEVYVGVGARRVRELFQAAKSRAPAIIFIDEIEAVGGKRNSRDSSYHMQTLNQMLTELDGFDQSTGVVFIAATNFPQMLDKALTRPGRFDRQINIPLPDVRGRVDILKHYTRNMKIEGDVDQTTIARATPGFSGADLENLINQAAVQASKLGNKKVTMKDMEWSKDRIIMGAERKSMVMQPREKVNTAYHEAGHTLVGIYTGACDPLYKVTIMPRGHALGATFNLPDMDRVSMTKEEMIAQIDLAMGGKMAEELIYGADKVTTGSGNDLESATRIAYGMVMNYGFSETLGPIAVDRQSYQTLSPDTKSQIEVEVRKILEEGQRRAKTLLTERRKELELLAQALMKYETLSKDEVEKVIQGEELKDKLAVLPDADVKIPPSASSSSGPGGSSPGAGETDAEAGGDKSGGKEGESSGGSKPKPKPNPFPEPAAGR